MHEDKPKQTLGVKLRIRNNRSMNIDATQHKRNRSMSLNMFASEIVQEHPADYLKQVQKIIDGARGTSKTLNLEFRKYSSKPEMQMMYVDSSKMQKKLQQMGTRLESNKFQIIVEVRRDPMDALATKKEVIKDEIQRKNYKSIYKQYIKDYNGENFELVKNPLIALYQFYDEEEKDWKDQLKNKCLISREVRRETLQKMLQSRSKMAKQARLAKQKQLQLQQLKLSKLQQQSNEQHDQLRASHRTAKSQKSEGFRSRWFKNTKYDEIFEQVAEANNLYQPPPNAPNPQKIILNRFQQKFYRCRQKKYQHLFDRAMTDESQQQQLQKQTNNRESYSQLKKTKKLIVPQMCKRMYKTQNKLLEQGITNGLSRDNAKKLIVQFNKTIVQMKAKQTTPNKQARTIHVGNGSANKYKIKVHK